MHELIKTSMMFKCEKLSARMHKRHCLNRRNRALEIEISNLEFASSDDLIKYQSCLLCQQGEKVYKEILSIIKKRHKIKAKMPMNVPPRMYQKLKIYDKLSDLVLECRRTLQCSQRTFGKYVGLHDTTISRVENKRPISDQTARILYQAIEDIKGKNGIHSH